MGRRQSGPVDGGVKVTVKTYDKFTKWNGWNDREVQKHSHKLISINIKGEGIIPGNTSQYPEAPLLLCGDDGNRVLTVKTRAYKSITGTVPAELMDRMFAILKRHTSKMNLRVSYMTTRNCFGNRCLWELYKGEMILVAVDGTSYLELSEKELISAADDLYFDGCEVKREQRIVGFACSIGEGGEKIKVKSGSMKKPRSRST